MNPVELDMMKGMISILNDSKDKLTSEQYNIRLQDLKQIEEETKTKLIGSPTCEWGVESIIEIKEIENYKLKECSNVDSIIDFVNQNETIVYIDVVGLDAIITYTNGVISNVQIDNACIDIVKILKSANIPYQINSDNICIVKGKIVLSEKPVFYVTNLFGNSNNIDKNLNKAKELGFDIIPYWLNTSLNSKTFDNGIDYIYNYSEENELSCNGVVFEYNDIEQGNHHGIVYNQNK